MRPRAARETDGAEEFEGETVLPVFFGERFEIAALSRACVVDQDIKAAEFIESGVHDLFSRIRLAEIAGDDRGCRARLRGDFAQGFFVARGKEDVSAFEHQAEGDGASDAATCAGDDGCLSFERHSLGRVWRVMASSKAVRSASEIP